MEEFNHETVLLTEAVEALNVKKDGLYVDGTLGGGGHSKLILSKLDSGHLYAFDQDKTAIKFNQKNLEDFIQKNKVSLIESNFTNLKSFLNEFSISSVDGILYDLGVSSPQFDNPERGFSYRYDAPLDMRMDQSSKLTAKSIVNEWSFNDLMYIFRRYGEEPYAKQIVRKIEKARQKEVIETTFQLVELIKEALPFVVKRKLGHPAKRSFQAIRIAVNDEINNLEAALDQSLEILNPGGRLVVITFHSLEDRIVKNKFKDKTKIPDFPQGLPVIPDDLGINYKLIVKKPILPQEQELKRNNRSRSAQLRIIERI